LIYFLFEEALIVKQVVLPQVGENKTPQPMDVAGEFPLYDTAMTRTYLADAKIDERSALRLLLLDLGMEVIGEAADWQTVLHQVPVRRVDMLLVDWDLLPAAPALALGELRDLCPTALVVVLLNHLDARRQTALSAGADAFISKDDLPDHLSERLRLIAANTRI
jgi:DNA-binding NarL/FixJ family response regulator